jgi:large subunit ribosomal protein L4
MPVWVGGGTVHGPQPHAYTFKLPKKVKRLARFSALSLRCSENNIVVVEVFNGRG